MRSERRFRAQRALTRAFESSFREAYHSGPGAASRSNRFSTPGRVPSHPEFTGASTWNSSESSRSPTHLSFRAGDMARYPSIGSVSTFGFVSFGWLAFAFEAYQYNWGESASRLES
jgi:hypothetical protein